MFVEFDNVELVTTTFGEVVTTFFILSKKYNLRKKKSPTSNPTIIPKIIYLLFSRYLESSFQKLTITNPPEDTTE